MLHPRLTRVPRIASVFAITIMISACQHGETISSRATKTFVAGDINVDQSTVGGTEISTLVDEDVRLRGFVKSSPKGNTIMFLSNDVDQIDPDSYRNCINLIIDRKIGFNSPDLSSHTFMGRFVLIERLDPSVVFLAHEGIRFNTDCQALKRPNSYPYFLVKSFN